MLHKLILMSKDNTTKDITKFCSDFSWSSSVDNIGIDASFKSTKLFNNGDKIFFYEDGILVSLLIIVSTSSNIFENNYNCLDFAHLMNESDIIIQFNNVACSDAIKKITNSINIKSNIVNISTMINGIYKNYTPYRIIKELLKQAEYELNKKYTLTLEGDIVYIKPYATEDISELKILIKDKLVPITKTISRNISFNSDIEGLKNSILVVNDDEKSTSIIQKSQDKESINFLGLRQEIVELKNKNEAQTRNIAKNRLLEKNKITRNVSFQILGNHKVTAGKTLKLDNRFIKGNFVIKTASHSLIKGGYDKINLTLEEIEVIQ